MRLSVEKVGDSWTGEDVSGRVRYGRGKKRLLHVLGDSQEYVLQKQASQQYTCT